MHIRESGDHESLARHMCLSIPEGNSMKKNLKPKEYHDS